jgi:hypothetical protein
VVIRAKAARHPPDRPFYPVLPPSSGSQAHSNEIDKFKDCLTATADHVGLLLWALLWLPAQLRRAWEQRFPVLAEISRITVTA